MTNDINFWTEIKDPYLITYTVILGVTSNITGYPIKNRRTATRFLSRSKGYYQDLIATISNRSQALLDQLIKRNNLPSAMRRVKRTLAKHRQEIIASFYIRLTNGPIEGTNNKIKIIKRTAYGYRNFFHFRIRILISLKTSNLMIRELSKKRTRPKAKVA